MIGKVSGWIWLLLIVISIVIGVTKGVIGDKEKQPPEARVVEYHYIPLHSFPEGVNQITIPIRPERWEGVALPLDATAYDVDATVWRQIRTWNGKDGPILKKGQSAYMPIQKNRNISEATFWIRGEGEATISIERKK